MHSCDYSLRLMSFFDVGRPALGFENEAARVHGVSLRQKMGKGGAKIARVEPKKMVRGEGVSMLV